MLRPGSFGLALLAVSACTGDIMGGTGDDAPGGGVAFLAPAHGSIHVRDTLAPDGWLAADVGIVVDADGADTVEIAIGDRLLGTVDGDGELQASVRDAGTLTLTARARRGDQVIGEATVEVTVTDPEVATCRAWLDLYQLDYASAAPSQGVEDPLTVRTPINGMAYRYVSNTSPRAQFNVMHCELARSLARAAPILRSHGIVEVADIGVYNYRCIGGGTPPDCPQGISEHAYARAIDIAGFTDSTGAYASVNDDWVIDPSTERTCSAATEPGADAFLHQVICELKAAGVWNIVLTPNYNSAHRNHFHVDLTPGADYIRSGTAVDTGPDRH
jgi:hypothetical protein